MNLLTRWWLIVTAFAAVAAAMIAEQARPGEPGGPGEYRDFKVLKTYSAKDGDYVFHAFVIEWEGQPVIASDYGALITAFSDQTINVLVSRGLPRPSGSPGRILFLARPEKKPPAEIMQLRDPVEIAAAQRSVKTRLKVQKVYSLRGGDYGFRAYEVEWQRQAVIVSDPIAVMNYEVGDEITVLVTKRPHIDANRASGLLEFTLTRPDATVRPKRR